MPFRRGDHICRLYSTREELATTVGDFVSAGLAKRERCWYVASGDEESAVREALVERGVDVRGEIGRGALRIIPAKDAYRMHGRFDPESTLQVFNDAIEESLQAGFAGFRAAADMSWALEPTDSLDDLIIYEALLRTLFANCGVIGLCLYDRERMPLAVLNGALATHPVLSSDGERLPNPFYDSATRRLSAVDDGTVRDKLRRIASVG